MDQQAERMKSSGIHAKESGNQQIEYRVDRRILHLPKVGEMVNNILQGRGIDERVFQHLPGVVPVQLEIIRKCRDKSQNCNSG